MKINGEEVSIEKLSDIVDIDNVILKHRNNGILLSDYQINVLKRCGIDYEKFNSVRELMYDIEDLLNDEYDEELDTISSQLAEYIYYNETKKWDIRYLVFLFDYIFLDKY